MALPDLSGSLIQDTYQRVLHTNGTAIFDGTGSTVLSQTELTSLQAIGSADISATEWAEIAAIGNANITAGEWSYLAGATNVNWDNLATIEQNMANSNAVTFLKNIATATIVQDDSPAFTNASSRCGFAFNNSSATSSMYILFNRGETPIEFKRYGHISMSGDLTSSAVKIINNNDSDNPIEYYASNGTDLLAYVNVDGIFVGNVIGNATTATDATNADTATNATNIIAGSNAEDEEQFIAFLDNGNTSAQGIKYDGGIKYNPSKDRLTLSGGITGSEINSTGNISSSLNVYAMNTVAITGATNGQTLTQKDGENANVMIENGHITASGDISASGNIYSNNTEIIQYSYQNENSQEKDEWYGPNSQGPSYYYWAKKFSNHPDVGLSHFNSAFVLPYKAELVSCTYTVHCLTAFDTNETGSYTGSLLVRDASTITFPVLTSVNANANIDIQGQAGVTMSKQNGQYRITVPVSGTYSEGSYVYPRTNVSLDNKNWRGNFALKIRRVK